MPNNNKFNPFRALLLIVGVGGLGALAGAGAHTVLGIPLLPACLGGFVCAALGAIAQAEYFWNGK